MADTQTSQGEQHGHDHHHQHHEHHEHEHSAKPGEVDYAAVNRDHFDKNAHKYDNFPFAYELTEKIANGFLKEYNFKEDSTEVMEFACGTGLVSQQLASHVKSILGVDISQGMVDQYNMKVKNHGIPEEEMRAVSAELKGEEGELDGKKFDVIVCSMAYHHFSSIEQTTRVLFSFLKPGGTLLVADGVKSDEMDPFGQGDSLPRHIVAHRGGFAESEIREAFEKAGFVDISWRPSVRITIKEKEMKIFVAKGIRPV